jgi:hypothetical protein
LLFVSKYRFFIVVSRGCLPLSCHPEEHHAGNLLEINQGPSARREVLGREKSSFDG